MKSAITGYHQDAELDWVAELACGHFQHVRHNPPFAHRPWVTTPAGRESRLGVELECKKCNLGAPADQRGVPRAVVEGNRQRTLELMQAIARGDANVIAETCAEDGKLHVMGHTLISGVYSKAQIRQFTDSILNAFPEGLHYTIHATTAEADRVAVEATGAGQHVSGKSYVNHYHCLFTWRDGKLLELKEYMDTEVVTEVLCGDVRPI
ncbi:DUF3565 domain-containing protein [Kineobactrum salinum]|uniref:DUF3565 domain-containing protein n=1 Tax=Kineobactrum salinum TaxID=2708301 RepID=A0A6C0U4C2_9GAMM|nr:DUF3565 domain-containing protein [Kineobactrum salinum]QIB66269.1 DUF3565 domain-containing protein [Kineobactrum salinum]